MCSSLCKIHSEDLEKIMRSNEKAVCNWQFIRCGMKKHGYECQVPQLPYLLWLSLTLFCCWCGCCFVDCIFKYGKSPLLMYNPSLMSVTQQPGAAEDGLLFGWFQSYYDLIHLSVSLSKVFNWLFPFGLCTTVMQNLCFGSFCCSDF